MSCILNSDLLSCLKLLPDNTFDGVFCDPPYELGFMGKSWDSTGVAFQPETWAEVLRVCKPGAHLLAFGGSRTFHRLVCAVEDAGWEVRDVLMYLYGSGFPKSLDVQKQLEKQYAFCRCSTCNDNLSSLRDGANNAVRVVQEGEEPDMQQTLQRGTSRARMGETRAQGGSSQKNEAGHARGKEPGMERGSDAQEAEGELLRGEICESTGLGASDGPKGRVHHGTQACHGGNVQEAPNARGGSEPHRPQSGEQLQGKSRVVADKRNAQARGDWPTCRRCGLPLPCWDGYGTALKPAYEPVVLARKPLDGTVAQNVQKWGCGALWIDGARVTVSDDDDIHAKNPHTMGGFGHGNAAVYGDSTGSPAYNPAQGRWPANVLHDGSPEVLAGFPVTGPSKSGGKSGSNANPMSWNEPNVGRERIGHNDNGGSAARYFYCAKASTKERNAGCEGRNVHPTVKPLDLCRYLATLILPPADRPQGPRRLLVPFSGSGSEMVGAILAGWDDVTGIEREAEYVEIAKARLSHHSGKPPVVLLPEWLDL